MQWMRRRDAVKIPTLGKGASVVVSEVGYCPLHIILNYYHLKVLVPYSSVLGDVTTFVLALQVHTGGFYSLDYTLTHCVSALDPC